MKEAVVYLDPESIEIKDHTHRTKLDIASLSESIQAVGQINPITVKKVGRGYQVVAGRRRLTAIKHLHKTGDSKIRVAAIVRELSDIAEELILIDENLMRQNLGEAEFDEALYRRKQLYEQLHPETKKNVSGGIARSPRTRDNRKLPFSEDAARKLGTNRRSVERAIARAAKATDKVKKARAEGLSPSKVNLLVSLDPYDQDTLLPAVKNLEVAEVRSLVEQAKKRGAKAVMLDFEEIKAEDPRLKPLVRDALKLSQAIQEALEERLTLEGTSKHDSLRALDLLQQRIMKFTSFQRAALGYIKAISRKDGQTKLIRENKR
jgi:ParB/RepB/Spo0J family partition protein